MNKLLPISDKFRTCVHILPNFLQPYISFPEKKFLTYTFFLIDIKTNKKSEKKKNKKKQKNLFCHILQLF